MHTMGLRTLGSGALAALLMCSLLPGLARGAETITWTGLGDGTSWGQTANWDLGRLPNGNDDVVIPDVAGTTVIVAASGASCGNLTSEENIQVTGGNLYLYGTGTVNADLAFSTSGSYQGASTGTMTVNGHLIWTSGQLFQITIIANGTLEIAGTGSKTTWSATLENRGIASWNAGNISLAYSTLRNASGAELTVYADGAQVQASGTPGANSLFDNQGTFALAAGVSGQVQSPFQNSGTVRVESGTLTLSSSCTSSGAMDLADGAVLLAASSTSLNGTASITGTGTLRLQSNGYLNGTHQIGAGVELLPGANLYVYGATTVNGAFTTLTTGVGVGGATGGVLTLNGPVTLNGGNFANITTIANGDVIVAGNTSIWSSAVFESHGVIDWNAGDISLSYSGILRILAGGYLHIHADGHSLYHSAGPPGDYFENQGEIISWPNSATIAEYMQGPGRITVFSGTLTVLHGSISGDIYIGADAMLDAAVWNEGITVGGDADITGTGTLRVSGGTGPFTFTGTHVINTPVEQTSGNISVNGRAEFNGSYAHTNDGAWLTGSPGALTILNGDVTWVGGHLGGGCDEHGLCSTIVVNGNMTADFPVGPSTWCWLFGTLENHGVFTQTGWLRICGDGLFLNAPRGKHHLSGLQTVVSCCTYSCGSYSNAGSLFLEYGATINFPAGNGGRDYTQTGGSTVLNGTTLTAAGGVNLQGGTFYGNGAVEGDVVSGASLAPGLSPGQIDVTGTYTQNSPGALAIEIAGPDPGTGYDVVAMTGAATLSGTLNVTLLDGYDPPVGATFDILTAASVTGDFDTTNLATLPGNKHWQLTYLGQAVRLTVRMSGDLNCDGYVNFDDINPFVAALVGRTGYEAQYPQCRWLNGDIDGNGAVDFDDINPFVACLVAGRCP